MREQGAFTATYQTRLMSMYAVYCSLHPLPAFEALHPRHPLRDELEHQSLTELVKLVCVSDCPQNYVKISAQVTELMRTNM